MFQFRGFATNNNDGSDSETPIVKKKARASKAAVQPPELDQNGEIVPKPVMKKQRKIKSEEEAINEPQNLKKMYVLKFNSPILPYAKFPLTQNKYIQDFLKMYEVDKDKVEHVIGVHFPQNNNSMAKDTVGIEIKIVKKNNLTVIESTTSARYRVHQYD